MGKNKNKHNKPENPRLPSTVAKIGNSEKSKLDRFNLKKLNDQLNFKNLNSDQIAEIIKITNLNGKKQAVTKVPSNKTTSENIKSVSTEIESGELDQTMADSSELNSFYENPLKKDDAQKDSCD